MYMFTSSVKFAFFLIPITLNIHNLLTQATIMMNSINVPEKTNEELIADLEAKKAEAIASDDFEEAIKIRDQIKKLQSKEITKGSESNLSEKADQREVNIEEYQKEINDMKVEAYQEKQDKINYLTWKLNEKSEMQDQNSILHECEERIADWRDYFNALNWDQEAINRKINEFNYKNTSIIKSPYFLKLDDLSEEDLQKEYMKYFEPQTSEYYLWWIINTLYTESFRIWFFSAINWKEWKINEEFSKIIRITQKLVNISKKANLN